MYNGLQDGTFVTSIIVPHCTCSTFQKKAVASYRSPVLLHYFSSLNLCFNTGQSLLSSYSSVMEGSISDCTVFKYTKDEVLQMYPNPTTTPILYYTPVNHPPTDPEENYESAHPDDFGFGFDDEDYSDGLGYDDYSDEGYDLN